MNIAIENRQGKKLSVRVTGPDSAPAILFSNSLGTDMDMWQPQVNALKADYRVVTYDTRGHGRSDVIGNTTLEDLANDVVDIMDNLSLARAHFCGISMGGITGLWLAIHRPQRFQSLTVANSAARIGTQKGWEERAQTVLANGLSALAGSAHARWFSENFDYKSSAPAMRTIQSLSDTSSEGYCHACSALASANMREQIHQIRIPTLIISGTLDPVTTVADGQFMQSRIPGSKLCLLGASHLSNIEQPEAFSQQLRRFIESAT